MDLNDDGVPVNYGDSPAAPACPPSPCKMCTGFSSLMKNGRKQTSWEWCQEFNTCAATVDWDRLFGY